MLLHLHQDLHIIVGDGEIVDSDVCFDAPRIAGFRNDGAFALDVKAKKDVRRSELVLLS